MYNTTTHIPTYSLSLHDALPIYLRGGLPCGDELRGRVPDADDLLLPEQPVGNLRPGERADGLEDARDQGARVRVRGGARRWERRPRGDRGHGPGRGQGPRGRRADDDRGRHVPDGTALLERRPDAVPARGAGRGVEA